MFAVIKTGGKQYRVAAEDVITIERVAGEPGDIVGVGEVLMLGGDSVSIGTPLVSGASVAGEVVRQSRGAKVIAFKKRRRQNSRRKRGHRQEFTVIRITEILTDGKQPTIPEKKAAPEPQASDAVLEAGSAGIEAEAATPKAKSAKKPKSTKKPNPAKKPKPAAATKSKKK